MLNLHMDLIQVPFLLFQNQEWAELKVLFNVLCWTHSVTYTCRPFPLPGWSWSRHCGVGQHVRDTSPRHQYSFGTPWLTVPSVILAVSCTCQQKQKPLCQAAAIPPPPLPPFRCRSLWSPPHIPQSMRSQGQQASPNCMLIRATHAFLWLLTTVWHQGGVANAESKQGHDAEMMIMMMMMRVLDFHFLTVGTKQHYFLKPLLWIISYSSGVTC